MKNSWLYILILVLLTFFLIGFKFIGAIFNVGVYVGIFLVVLFAALIAFAVVRFGKRD